MRWRTLYALNQNALGFLADVRARRTLLPLAPDVGEARDEVFAGGKGPQTRHLVTT